MCNINLTTSAWSYHCFQFYTSKVLYFTYFGQIFNIWQKKGKKPFKINWVFFLNCRMSNIQILTTWTGKQTSPLAHTLLDYRLWSTKSKQKEWDLSSSWSVWNIDFKFQSGITKWRIYSSFEHKGKSVFHCRIQPFLGMKPIILPSPEVWTMMSS